jgi:diguanylate cyclase (GGDEF)-like protein
MVNTDAASCMASAQRICEAIYKHKYEMNAISIQNRISIGMAEYPKDGETMLDLIQSADTAMYSAKEQGGNQVVKFKTGMAPKSKQ